MPSPTLILGSGHGLSSLSEWLRASVSRPELLLLDVRYVHRQSSSSFGNKYFEARFLLPSNLSLSLGQVLPSTNSDWLLTSWSAQKADSGSWGTSGRVGEGGGEGRRIRSTTGLGPICS